MEEQDVRYIAKEEAEKYLNGGNKCQKGTELEGRIISMQGELAEEKKDRQEKDEKIFDKLDDILKTFWVGIGLLIIGVVAVGLVTKFL